MSNELAAPTERLLGMPLTRITSDMLVTHVFSSLAEGRGGWVITANVDHLQRYVTDPALRLLCHDADLIVADGVPLLWAARLRERPLPGRVAGSDLVWSLAARAASEGRSLFLLGGDPGVAEEAAATLQTRWPRLRIAGTASPRVSDPPRPEELAPIREILRKVRPDLVYVALGAPKQERVIHALRAELPFTWWLGVGISLSFIAGRVDRAPVWMQRIGLEWAHRLAQEPGRLARRYLLDDLPFVLRLLVHARRTRR